MSEVRSNDGTRIGYERAGAGPALILVDGARCSRQMGPMAGLAKRLTRWASMTLPILVSDGGKSPPWMRNAQRALCAALPHAELRTLAGQTHMVGDKVLAPLLIQFFNETSSGKFEVE